MIMIMITAGFDARVPEFWVKTVGCRILGDLENITDDTVNSEIIPSIANLPTFVLNASKLKKLVSAVVQASPLDGV